MHTYTLLKLAALVSSSFLLGCPKPSVEISVNPSLICDKGEVTVSWKVSRVGNYEVAPEIGQFITPVNGASGSRKITVDGTTKFVITGHSSVGLKQDSATVEVGRSGQVLNLVLLQKSCSSTHATYETEVKDGAPRKFAKNEVIQNVHNPNSRNVTVSHAFTSPIAANSSTSVFNGQSPTGTWSISTRLRSDETCPTGVVVPNPNDIPPPASLRLRIEYGCK